MTGFPLPFAFLRQLPLDGAAGDLLHPLPATAEVMIGRDPRCQVVLDSEIYGGVSRQHAKICPIVGATRRFWQLCDLGSANGTYINGQRLIGCRTLQVGDRIILGQNGPRFVFELQSTQPSNPTNPGGSPLSPFIQFPAKRTPSPTPLASDSVTLSQLFPIVSTGRDLTSKAYLIPGVVTISFVVMMFVAIGNAIFFNMLVAVYISGAAFYFVYQLCGKHKPWWLLIGVALSTALILVSPMLRLFIIIFRGILPGDIPQGPPSGSFLTLLVQMFFGAGLMEELLKALPVLAVYFIGTNLRSPLRERIGVWEPLDGILLGTASALGFTLLETLGQYVPAIVNDITLQAGTDTGQLLGLQLLIPRILGSIAGHMAYSGYLGYFIGLSVLKPSKRWQILGVGYLTASILHALWNASGIISFLVLALVGVLSYAFLGAAILKARALSPNRSENFATRFSKTS